MPLNRGEEEHVTERTGFLFRSHSLAFAAEGEGSRITANSEVVFLDPRLRDASDLLAQMPANVEVVYLDPSANGLEQILAFFAEADHAYRAVHIVTHGSEGEVSLGGISLGRSSIGEYSALLRAIGAYLPRDADLLLYGCNVAQGDDGLAFLTALSEAVGVDVAASDDLSGASALGGDASLEVTIGDVVTAPIVSQEQFDAMAFLLNAPPASITPSTSIPWYWGNPFGDFTTSGSIGSSSEVDLYRFIPDQSGNYVFTISGALDAQLRIYTSSGAALTGVIDSAGGGGTESTTQSLTTGQWYYVAVTGFQATTGSYSLSVNGPSVPSTATISTPGPAYAGSYNSGDIGYGGDLDYFTVTAPSGVTSLTISVDPSSGLNSWVEVYNSSGSLLQSINSSNTTGGVDSATISVTAGATYYIGVSGQLSTQTGTFTLDVDFAPDQVVNTGDPPSSITPGTGPDWIWANQLGDVSTSASISSGTEVDLYRLMPDQSGAYTITLSGSLNGQLRVYDQNGAALTGVIDSNGAGGSESTTISFTTGQWFYMAVAGSGTATGSYTLSVNGPSIPSTATISTPGPAYAGSYNSGDIGYGGDLDYFTLTAPSGVTSLTISVDPSSGLNSWVEIYNSAGALIQSFNTSNSTDGVDTATISVTAGSTYYVGVSGVLSTQTGSFVLTADFNPDQSGNAPPTISGPTSLTRNTNTTISFVGLISANDSDGQVVQYRFSDGTPGAGYLTLDGAHISGTSVTVSAADLNRVGYFTDSNAGSNAIAIEAIDNLGAASPNYLTTTITVTSPSAPSDTAGETRATARDLGVLAGGANSLTEAVGANDHADYFRFEVTQAGALQASISAMVADADLFLLSETGSVLRQSRAPGSATDSVSYQLTPGVYYLNVDQYQGDTSYLLQYTFTPTAAPPAPPLPNLQTAQSLFGGAMYATLAAFALSAYSDHQSVWTNELESAGWRAVNLTIAGVSVSNGFYVHGNAELRLARSADALVISFTGTEWNNVADFANWPEMSAQFALYDAIITAINSYVIGDASIARVYVTGHSLGAAMVDAFMSSHQDFTRSNGATVSFEAATFGHPDFQAAGWGPILDAYAAASLPGALLVAQAGVPDWGTDHRVVNFLNAQDLIGPFDFADAGLIPRLTNVLVYAGGAGGHSPDLYADTLDYLLHNGISDAMLRSVLGGETRNSFLVPATNATGDNTILMQGGGLIAVGGPGNDTYQVRLLSIGDGVNIVEVASSGAGDTLHLLGAFGVADFNGVVRLEVEGDDLRVIPIVTTSYGSQEMAPVTILGQFTPAGRVEFIRYNGQTAALPTSAAQVDGWGGAVFLSVSASNVTLVEQPSNSVGGTIDAHGGASLFDTVSLAGFKTDLLIDIGAGVGTVLNGLGAGVDVLLNVTGIENVISGEGNDNVTGNSAANHIETGSGNDTVDAGDGNDTIVGGDGPGDDTYLGGDGVDTVVYSSASSALTIDLSASGVNATGAEIDNDQLAGIENVVGGSGNDQIIGSAGANILSGGAGDDHLSGDPTTPTSITLQPGPEGQDLWITDVYTYGSNYGVDDGELRIGGWGDHYNALLRFDLVNLALGGHIEHATLRLYNLDFHDGSPTGFFLDLVNTAWDESYGWHDYALSTTNLATLSAAGIGWYEIDITAAVNAWLANPSLNFGLQLRPTSNNNNWATFVSSDATGSLAPFRPTLVIDTGAQSAPANAGGDDTLIGGAGNDSIEGGGGVDRAGYSLASTEASWLRNLDGSWTVTSAEGVDTLRQVEFLAFTDRDVFLDRAVTNFSGDGTSDILLRRTDGVTAIWSMNGATVASSGVTQWQAGSDWQIQGVGDFNSDGRDDFLLRRLADGVTAIWSMNGTNVIAADVTLWQAGSEWQIQAVGDFNCDGSDDFLWRRTSDGVTAIWQMNGTNVVAADVTLWQAGNEWQIQGVGDFNGDGRDDFLWRRTSDGVTAIWSMNGTNVLAADVTSQTAGNEWTFTGIGDFNGDGRDDLLLRRNDGAMAIWLMNGTSITSAGLTSQQAGTDWNVAAIGDYNGDGRDDILMRHDSGVMAVWTMNGFVVSSAITTQTAGPEWTPI